MRQQQREKRRYGWSTAGLMAFAILTVACGGGTTEETAPAEDPAEAAPAEVTLRDINLDGTEDTVYLYAPLAGEDTSRAEADTDGDGEIDLWAVLGTDGQSIRQIGYDTDGSGRPNAWERFEGVVLAERSRDTSGDGQPDSWTVYDAEGHVVETRQDADGNGQVDAWSTYWPDGTIQRAAYDTDGNGQPDRWMNYRDDGSLASVETDTDGDGTPDQLTEARQ